MVSKKTADSKEVDVFDLQAVEGVGKATEEKLNAAGITSVLDLAAATPRELVEIGLSAEKAEELCLKARLLLIESGFLDKEFVPATEVLERRKSMQRVTTGSSALDSMLGGGVETQAITELIGEYGCGKTQICHTLCVTTQLPRQQGGLEGTAIYIDTEATFRPERISQIAEGRGLDPQKVLENVIFASVYNSSHLQLTVKELGRYIEKYKARLVVVDSIISHFRAEYVGRGTLAERQQRLNDLLHRLLRTAQMHNVAVVVTNQVQANPDQFFGDPNKPSGGHVLAHSSTYRIFIRRAANNTRLARIIDSPYHPPTAEAYFKITEKGVEDLQEGKQ
ncbi:MAG: DNA repair and recombination protein RadA [Candidatus Caldarchaeum sp.]|nr:DNA repair and recombination protein RadA [Candidatus Caldarchaeum sp.]MCS7137680.1 DNA repair and recombination protein RadA [Candidatus Caldarchaeum sp.]MDW7978632.1 DNA repair and recombination protein RadA [Candidatus Caldarchaeum sp.]MDW8359336.1 DNA repair and recombination protein RadA [Candidatus Caldarchaeum sp.]